MKDIQYFLSEEEKYLASSQAELELVWNEELEEFGFSYDPLSFLGKKPFQSFQHNNIDKENRYGLTDVEKMILTCFLGNISYAFRDDNYYGEVPDIVHEMQIILNSIINKAPKFNGNILYRFTKTGDKTVFTCKKLLMTKKKLPVRFTGQHFTIDKVLIKDAIRQANISNQDTVLDIGAGKGFLTVHLLKIANNVVAIENDTALVEHLRKLFSDARNVQVVGCDFRNFAVPKFPFKVVSNIPYGITSDIFKILMFESLGNFLGGSIVLQLEPTQKLFSRKLYNPYTVFYHTFLI